MTTKIRKEYIKKLLICSTLVCYKFIKKSYFSLLFFCFFSCSSSDDYPATLNIMNYPNRKEDFSLWQLAQFHGEAQMGYFIKTDDGKVMVIDGGISSSSKIIEQYLLQLGDEVSVWIITHPHKDHAGAILEIINNKNIKINKIVHASLDNDWVQAYEENALTFVSLYNERLTDANIEKVEPLTGDQITLGEGVVMTVLGAVNPQIKINAVNNSSLVFKISSKSKSVLFLGDLGKLGGESLINTIDRSLLKSDYVQMSHHGQAGVNKAFYTLVDADYSLWPTPVWLWENNLNGNGYNSGDWETLTVRQWMIDLEIEQNFVSGLIGTKQID